MSTGFKQATVNASDVPATLTNYPAFVDLARLNGGTAMSTADADSIRVYSDVSKTTELAREIVSGNEMHVKIPSLTSSFVIYVDWDGVRSDYAVTDTYGRNAVWSDYSLVYHMNDATTSTITDSTGGGNTGTKVSAGNPDEIDFVVGKGQNFDTGDYILTTNNINLATLTLQSWFNNDAVSGVERALVSKRNGSNNGIVALDLDGGSVRFYTRTVGIFRIASASFSSGVDIMAHGTYDGTTGRLYTNGTQAATFSYSGTIPNLTFLYEIGRRPYDSSALFDGKMDEVRIRSGALSANWITTEYNNQSDEAGFWGTWTDAGGGASYRFVPQIKALGGL